MISKEKYTTNWVNYYDYHGVNESNADESDHDESAFITKTKYNLNKKQFKYTTRETIVKKEMMKEVL